MNWNNDQGEQKAFEADRQADAWHEFLMTGRPSALVRYLQHNGPVDAEVRAAIIDTLRSPDLLTKGGRDSWRDYKAFVSINAIATREGVSKTEACRRYAKHPKQELRAVQLQYQRGAKIFSSESDLFIAVDDNEP